MTWTRSSSKWRRLFHRLVESLSTGTAELAEMVLLNLDVEDLLSASQVNQFFAASISASSKLQMKMYLRADTSAFWSSFFNDPRQSSIYCNTLVRVRKNVGKQVLSPLALENGIQQNRQVAFKVTLRVSRPDGGAFTFHEPPAKQKSMLICQPPITEVRATPVCDHVKSSGGNKNGDPAAITIHRPEGITVADLIYAAQQITAASTAGRRALPSRLG